jgi:formylglycine-generating enzyme required for sulfatase activity
MVGQNTTYLIGFIVCLSLFGGCSSTMGIPATSSTESMVIVPAGWFTMGRDDQRRSNQPQRRVYLDTYSIDHTEVTNAAYAHFLAETNYQPVRGWDMKLENDHPTEPVTGMLWHEAEAYCRWVGKRLPSEAEWEKAARGTDARTYPWGDTWDASWANTAEGAVGDVQPVASYPQGASPYGVLDMCGNVAEWVNDFFSFDYYASAPDYNPLGPQQVLDHGLRGGSYADPAEFATTYFRNSSHSVLPNPRVGFRCALTISEE